MQKISESSSENADGATQMHTQIGNGEMPFRKMEVNKHPLSIEIKQK